MRTIIGICSAFLVLLSAAAFGQDENVDAAPVDQVEAQEELDEEDEVPELVFDDEEPLESGDQAAEPAENGGRFIPTEQISQDLGVSFPANI